MGCSLLLEHTKQLLVEQPRVLRLRCSEEPAGSREQRDRAGGGAASGGGCSGHACLVPVCTRRPPRYSLPGQQCLRLHLCCLLLEHATQLMVEQPRVLRLRRSKGPGGSTEQLERVG